MPGLANIDASLKKAFRLLERMDLEFRAEYFNVLNSNELWSAGQCIRESELRYYLRRLALPEWDK